MPLTIALDGPVGAGKSSVADEAARRLGILHLDTGAMYRAIGLYTLRQGIPLSEEEAVSAAGRKVRVDVRYTGGAQHTLVEGEDVTGLIRTPEVSMAASTVARYARVRQAMVALQRRLGRGTAHAGGRQGHRHQGIASGHAEGVSHRLGGGACPAAFSGIAAKGGCRTPMRECWRS